MLLNYIKIHQKIQDIAVRQHWKEALTTQETGKLLPQKTFSDRPIKKMLKAFFILA